MYTHTHKHAYTRTYIHYAYTYYHVVHISRHHKVLYTRTDIHTHKYRSQSQHALDVLFFRSLVGVVRCFLSWTQWVGCLKEILREIHAFMCVCVFGSDLLKQSCVEHRIASSDQTQTHIHP